MGRFDQIDQPVTDQWSYHAVAAAILAHSLIGGFPEIDPKRIGVTGISWGGYLTDVVSGIDPRLRFAVPVYGCGLSVVKNLGMMGQERANKWLSLWDPSVYLTTSKMPMLGRRHKRFCLSLTIAPEIISFAERPENVVDPHADAPQSRRRRAAKRDRCIRECHSQETPVPRITKTTRETVEYKSKRPVVKAELNYTKDYGRWQNRKGDSIPAQLETKSHKCTARIPDGVSAWYINLFDDRDLVVSSEHVERGAR